MSSRPSWSLTRAIGSAFAERRIHIRTEGKTRYLSIRPATQIGGAVVVAALLGWTGFATTAIVASAMDGHSARVQLETMREAYEGECHPPSPAPGSTLPARAGSRSALSRSGRYYFDKFNQLRTSMFFTETSDEQTKMPHDSCGD